MNGKVLQIRLGDHGADGVGHTADTQLQACAIGDLRNDQVCNSHIHIRGSAAGAQLGNIRVLTLNDHGNVPNVDLGAGEAVDPGQLLVDFHDDALGAGQNISNMGTGNAKVEVAVRVHGSGLEHHNVNGIQILTIEAGQLRIAHRHEVTHTLCNDLAVNTAAVPGMPGKVIAGILCLCDLRHPHSNAAANLHIIQLVLTGSQSLVQLDGVVGAPGIIHPVAGLDNLYSLLSGDQFLLIHFLIAHCRSSCYFTFLNK